MERGRTAAVGLADLPTEVVERLLKLCATPTLLRMAGTCRALRRSVNAFAARLVHERMGWRLRVGLRCWDDVSPVQRYVMFPFLPSALLTSLTGARRQAGTGALAAARLDRVPGARRGHAGAAR